MSALDDLLARIQDSSLLEALKNEIAPLRGEKELGLVFERHLPEKVRLYGLPIRRGSKVEFKTDPKSDVWQVVKVNGKTASIRLRNPDGTVLTDNAELSDLVVVREFGDPIYPGLVSLGRVANGGDKPYHTVVKAENYHALETLQYTHAESIDLIIIDPPYNTGAKDWKYCNDYVDDNDSYRSSKWLSFMEKRLLLAKKLLKPDGILIVTIDEYELHTLGLLLKATFPSYLHYSVAVVINSRGSTGTRNFGVIDEKALFVVPDLGYDLISSRESVSGLLTASDEQADDASEDDLEAAGDDIEPDVGEAEAEPEADGGYWTSAYRTGAGTSYRKQRPNQFYPIYVDPVKLIPVRVGEPLLKRDKEGNLEEPVKDDVDGLVPVYPIDENGDERAWSFIGETMTQKIAAGDLKVGRFNERRGTWAMKVRRVKKQEARLKERTVWWDSRYDSGANGTTMLTHLLGEAGAFPFPKSLYTMTDLIAVSTANRPNAVILDFFGGSGTTMHATAYLNSLDGGSRTSIVVTNNEVAVGDQPALARSGHKPGDKEWEARGIFEQATMPRCRAAVTGVRPSGKPIPPRMKYKGGRKMADGFEENVEFFALTYEEPDRVRLGASFAAIAPLLWLKAGAAGARVDAVEDTWAIPEGGRYGVLFDPDSWLSFVEHLKMEDSVTHAFVVTDSDAVFQRVVAELPESVEAVRLYESYLLSFAINAGSLT